MMSVEHLESLAPSPRLAMADEIVVRLREAIVDGTLPPEEPLRESALAAILGVSRGPVREALSRLELEGLVVMRPNRSALVARMARADVEEVYSLRAVLEPLAIRRLCRAPDPAHMAELQAIVDAMRAAPGAALTPPEAAALDLRFHDALFKSSGHKRLINFWNHLKPQIYIFLLSRNTANPDFAELLALGHQEIVDALAAGVESRALEVINGHLEAGYQRVLLAYTP